LGAARVRRYVGERISINGSLSPTRRSADAAIVKPRDFIGRISPGGVFEYRPGLDADNVWFTLLTMNPSRSV
jgi:hypothetical protein